VTGPHRNLSRKSAIGPDLFGELIGLALVNWADVTNAPMGNHGIASAQLFGWEFANSLEIYYVCAVAMLICIWFAHRTTHRYFYTALRAVRADDQATAGMELPASWLKIFIFATNAGITGIAGSLLVHAINFIGSDMFGLEASIFILTIVVFGSLRPCFATRGQA